MHEGGGGVERTPRFNNVFPFASILYIFSSLVAVRLFIDTNLVW
jgi:hypothetical protein